MGKELASVGLEVDEIEEFCKLIVKL